MKKKYFEISNDHEADEHILIEEGYAGLTNKELQKMEDKVKKADEIRRRRSEEIEKIRQAEQQRLEELEKANPPWMRQKNKYQKEKYESGELVANASIPEDKKSCKTCAAKGLKRLIVGGAKLLKAELGIDGVTDEVYQERKKICLECPIYDFGVCVEEKGGCGCFLSAKCLISNERCPIEKW